MSIKKIKNKFDLDRQYTAVDTETQKDFFSFCLVQQPLELQQQINNNIGNNSELLQKMSQEVLKKYLDYKQENQQLKSKLHEIQQFAVQLQSNATNKLPPALNKHFETQQSSAFDSLSPSDLYVISASESKTVATSLKNSTNKQTENVNIQDFQEPSQHQNNHQIPFQLQQQQHQYISIEATFKNFIEELNKSVKEIIDKLILIYKNDALFIKHFNKIMLPNSSDFIANLHELSLASHILEKITGKERQTLNDSFNHNKLAIEYTNLQNLFDYVSESVKIFDKELQELRDNRRNNTRDSLQESTKKLLDILKVADDDLFLFDKKVQFSDKSLSTCQLIDTQNINEDTQINMNYQHISKEFNLDYLQSDLVTEYDKSTTLIKNLEDQILQLQYERETLLIKKQAIEEELLKDFTNQQNQKILEYEESKSNN